MRYRTVGRWWRAVLESVKYTVGEKFRNVSEGKNMSFSDDERHFRVPALTFVLHLRSNLWRRNARDQNFKRIFSSNFLLV